MRTFAQVQNRTRKPLSFSLAPANRGTAALHHREQSLLHLQRTIGNKAVLRLTSGDPVLANKLAHSVQQGFTTNRYPGGMAGSGIALQREEISPPGPGSPEQPSMRGKYRGHQGDDLRNHLSDLADNGETNYLTYRNAISKATQVEKRIALNTVLLFKLKERLGFRLFARCVEFLGRRAPTFDELRKDSTVRQALVDAWKASDVGTRDLVTVPHEEGGWVFMNLIDGSLSIQRAQAIGTNFIKVEPPPDVEDSVLVAIFHTHPHLGPSGKPSSHDKANDTRRGVPNLVVGNTGKNPAIFQVYLSGPSVRKHLASDSKIPGPSGGIPP